MRRLDRAYAWMWWGLCVLLAVGGGVGLIKAALGVRHGHVMADVTLGMMSLYAAFYWIGRARAHD